MIKRSWKNLSRAKKWWLALLLAVVVVAVSGCQTLSFYGQAVKGQYQLFSDREPIETVLGRTNTSVELRQQLELLQKLRVFAEQDLKLPVNGHYRKYVDVHRPYVVWNVEAAQEFSLEPKSWWYPLVGSLEYRGYFSEKGAANYALKLKAKGYDVTVGGVSAYSTLGWFKDPVLNTFIFRPEPDLAETIFHELAHQRVFARGDMDFNEAFATTVGEEGARRWLKAKADPALRESYLAQLSRTRQFVHLIMGAREKLTAVYGDERTEEGNLKATSKMNSVPRETVRQQKRAVLDQLEQQYKDLKAQWGGQSEYDDWFATRINNAKLNSVAAYYELVPGFEHLLELNGGDLEKFYVAAERLAAKGKKERHHWLKTLTEPSLKGKSATPEQAADPAGQPK